SLCNTLASGLAARVFFAGTRFTPPAANCISSFDSLIFGAVICPSVNGVLGAPTWDVSVDRSGDLLTALDDRGGTIQTTTGNPKTAGEPPKPTNAKGLTAGTESIPLPASPPKLGTTKMSAGSPVC